jgi:hypothetical protein
MKKVKYGGRHDAVELELPDGREIVVEHGKHVEVDDDLALRLCEQEDNWAPVGWKRPQPEPAAAADGDSDDVPAESAGEEG